LLAGDDAQHRPSQQAPEEIHSGASHPSIPPPVKSGEWHATGPASGVTLSRAHVDKSAHRSVGWGEFARCRVAKLRAVRRPGKSPSPVQSNALPMTKGYEGRLPAGAAVHE
jgi:hypothetical protein